SHSNDSRSGFFDKLQPLAADRVLKVCEPSDIAARPSKARDESRADRIRNLGEYDRDCAGGPLRGSQRRSVANKDHIRRRSNKLGRVGRIVLEIRAAPAILILKIASLFPSQLVEPIA